MQLYITNTKYVTRVPDIQLLDGHVPAIGTLTPDSDSADDPFPSMEPAVWFKVLVIDSVSIDCSKRAIHWTSSFVKTDFALESGSSDRERRKRISESMYVGGECHGYQNDLEELFESAGHLLNRYGNLKDNRETFHRQLFPLLHCFVLPNIKLNTDDLEELSEAHQRLEELIQICDQKLLAKSDDIHNVRKAMKKQRQGFITELLQSNLEYPAEFVKCLQKDIDVDIREEWGKIESQNEGIQSLKTESDPESSSSSSGSDRADRDCELELSVKRKEREDLLKSYEKMIRARETLHAMANGGSVVAHPPPGRWSRKKKKLKRKKPSAQADQLYHMYVGMRIIIRDMDNELQHITQEKVRLISVKEVIKSTVTELKENEESFGVDLDQTCSQRPTDILRQSKVPRRWQTFTEKVAVAINKGGSITKQYLEFQKRILNQCQGLLDEHEKLMKAVPLSSNDKEAGALRPVFYNPDSDKQDSETACLPRGRVSAMYREAQPSIGSLVASADHDDRQSTDFLFVFDQESDYLKKGIENLRRTILSHFNEMVDKFLTKLKMEKTDVNQRKVWLCYESYFYEAVMPVLVKVFDKAYASPMLNFQDFIPNLTIEDLNIEDTFVIHLLIPSETEDAQTSAMDSSGSPESREDETRGVTGKRSQSAAAIDETLQNTDACATRVHLVHEVEKLGTEAVLSGEDTKNKCNPSEESSEYSQEKSEGLTVSSLKDVLRKPVSCEAKQEKKKCDTDLELEPVFHDAESSKPDCAEERTHDSFDSARFSGDSDVRPKLQMIPSVADLSESSSLSSDSNENLQTSDINLKLLQEAEDIVAGLKTLNVEESRSDGQLHVPTYERSHSSPGESRHSTIPTALETVDYSSIVRQIQVHHPTSVTVVYHRCSWPLAHGTEKDIDSAVESADDALHVDDSPYNKVKATPSQLSCYKMVKFRPEIAKKFQGAFESLTNAITETAPLLKLQSLTSCLRILNYQLGMLQQEMGKKAEGASADDLLDLLVLLLCNYDPILACRLYPQITLLTEMMPPFFEGGPYSFSLVQFLGAFQYLADKMVIKQKIAENAKVRKNLESSC